MARVPIAPLDGTRLRPLPDAPLIPANLAGGQAQIGAALERTGQFGISYAEEQDRIDTALDMAAVKRADNEDAKWLREQLWTGDAAFYKQEGFNAANQRPVLEDAFRKRRETNLGGLTTDRQRRIYEETADKRFGAELVGVERHASTELRAEEKRQSLSRVNEASNDAVTYWDDPARRGTAIDTAVSEIHGMAASAGWSPEATAEAETKIRASITGRAVRGMMDRGKVEDALATRVEHARDLEGDPDALAALDGAMYGPLLDRKADGILDGLFAVGPTTAVASETAAAKGVTLPRMYAITGQAESGGRERNRDGSRVTSPKGAQGIMQVMPGTQRDPGFGVRKSNGTPEDDARVGRDYLAAMMKRYGNDPAKAWAAYNAGPGAVDNALAGGGDWLSKLPAETRAYVRGNIAALGGGTTEGQQARPQEHDLNQMLAQVDALNLPFDLEQKVKQGVMQRVNLDRQLLGEQRQRAEDDAWAYVEGKGDKFTSVDQLPSATRARLTPQQRLHFEGVAERNRTKDHETNWQTFARLSDEYASDPAGFVQRNPPSAIRAALGDTEFKQVMGWRQDVLSSTTGNGKTPKQVTHSRIREVTDPMLLAAGIREPVEPPGKKQKDPAAVTAYYQQRLQFQGRVQDDIAVWEKNHKGQEIDDDTIKAISDRQLLRMWRKTDDGKIEEHRAFERDRWAPGWNYGMPGEDAQRIRKTYRSRWNRDPTPAEMDQIYRRGLRGGQ